MTILEHCKEIERLGNLLEAKNNSLEIWDEHFKGTLLDSRVKCLDKLPKMWAEIY